MLKLKTCTDRHAHLEFSVSRLKWDDWLTLHNTEAEALAAFSRAIDSAMVARMVALHMEAMERFYEGKADQSTRRQAKTSESRC